MHNHIYPLRLARLETLPAPLAKARVRSAGAQFAGLLPLSASPLKRGGAYPRFKANYVVILRHLFLPSLRGGASEGRGEE